MTRNFRELEAKMSPRRVTAAKAKAREIMAGMFLAELRRRSGTTQTRLAAALGIKQPTIAKMEQQDDLQISTLRRIVEALGGNLDIVARLPTGDVSFTRPKRRGAMGKR
ncbi:MAG TPA: XRE family transcriptional regulator [Tepidisphaeraceae bacterium]|nr:XRE family transcriptional regulator [Tepidisphaeraceae bacterium]